MSQHQTGIEWTHFPGYTGAAWNPYVGCARVSPGCQNCYAERQAWRIVVQARAQGRLSAYERTVEIVGGRGCPVCLGSGVGPVCRTCWGFRMVGGEPRWTGAIRDAGKLDLPLRTKKPHAFFVNSMSDLFHERVTDEQITAAFGVAAVCPQHLFVILTKRIERGGAWSTERARRAAHDHAFGKQTQWPPPNVLIGPSVEDQQRADERMPHAMALAKAGWRVVVSYEPALGAVNWRPWLCRRESPITWLIVGAESGVGRRPFDYEWIPVEECADAGVALFVKQGSAHKPGQQSEMPDHLWAIKQFPAVQP